MGVHFARRAMTLRIRLALSICAADTYMFPAQPCRVWHIRGWKRFGRSGLHADVRHSANVCILATAFPNDSNAISISALQTLSGPPALFFCLWFCTATSAAELHLLFTRLYPPNAISSRLVSFITFSCRTQFIFRCMVW
jgi:hypothetical protein